MRFFILLLIACFFIAGKSYAALDTTFIYVCKGEQVDMKVKPGEPIYRWFKDMVLTSEETLMYSITSVVKTDEAVYWCRTMTDTSIFVLLVDTTKPVIISIADIKTVTKGSDVLLSVETVQVDSVVYTWFKGDTSITSTYANSINLLSIQESDTGSYYCVTTNICGSDTALITTVNIGTQSFAITEQPKDTAVCEGSFIQLKTVAVGSDTITYQWYKDGAVINNAIYDTLNILSAGSADAAKYKCLVSMKEQLDSTSEITLTVHFKQGISITHDTSICKGQSVQLEVSAAAAYLWNTGDTSSIITVSPTEDKVYKATVTDANGCYDSTFVYVSVISSASSLLGNDTLMCGGKTLELQAKGGDTYTWSTEETTDKINVTPFGTTKYSVTITTAGGCTASDEIQISISTSPVANAGNDIFICEGSDTLLIAKGGLIYNWDNSENNDSIVVSPIVTTTYTVTVINAKGCTDDDDVIVNVNQIAKAFAGNDTTICTGDLITLSATGGTLFNWSTNESSALIYILPSVTSTYIVTVSNEAGCSDLDSIVVHVNSLPIVNAGNDISICLGGSTVLYASGGDAYKWSTSDTSNIIIVAPTSDSIFYVSATTIQGCSAVDSIKISIALTLLPNAGVDTSICLGDSVMLFATGGINFIWDNTSTMDDSTVANPDVAPQVTITYTVTVSDGVCEGTDDVIVKVNNLVGFYASDDKGICKGDSVMITGNGVQTYLWNTTDTANSIIVKPQTTTTYTVTGTDLNGCKGIDYVKVTVNELPIADAGNDVNICLGTTTNLTADGGIEFFWNTSDEGEVIAVTPLISTVYAVTVVDINGCKGDDIIYVTVTEPIKFITEPKSKAVCIGDSISLQFLLEGNNITYQWQKNAVDITNATDSILIIKNFAEADTGVYTCKLSNICSTIVSTPAHYIFSNTVLTQQPQGKIRCKGEPLLLSVKADGSFISYQWQRNGIEINGATSATYVVSSADTSNSGIYRCETNACINKLSDSAVVVVNMIPAITQQPIGITLCDGDIIDLTVKAVGSSTDTYQWKKTNIDIIGADSSVYHIDSATYKDKGTYTCSITNMCGSITSKSVSLLFNSPVITKQPVAKNVCLGEDVVFSVTATGASGYQWLKDGKIIPGEVDYVIGLNKVDFLNEGIYACLVSNYCGSMLSNEVKLSINLPKITKQVPSDTLCESANVNLALTTTGTITNYAWYFNNSLNKENTTSTFYLRNASKANNEGSYYCKLTNQCGSVYSDTFSILFNKIIITKQPETINACLNDSVAFKVSALGIGLTYQWRKGGVLIPSVNDSILSIKKVSDADKGTYYCTISNACGTLNTLSINLLINIPKITNTITDKYACLGDSVGFNTVATGVGLTYQWYKNNAIISGKDSLFFNISNVSYSDSAVYYCIVKNVCDDDTTQQVKVILNEPHIYQQPQSIEACNKHTIVIACKVSGTGLKYQWYKDGNALTNASQSSYMLQIDTTKKGNYYCKIYNSCSQVITDYALVQVSYATTILSDRFVCDGQAVDLTLHMLGTGSKFIWKRSGTVIGTSTVPTYKILKPTKTDIGYYTCEINGSCGIFLSEADTLKVQYIINQPVWGVIKEGTTKKLSVKSSGIITEYAWFKDGTQIPFAKDSVYTINAFKAADAGSYKCMLTGDCGSFLSNVTPLYFDDGSGINDNDTKIKVSYYPNPASTVIYLNTIGFEGKTELSIYTNEGKQVYFESLNIYSQLNNKQLDVSNFAQGIYQLRISNTAGQVVKKLVIMK